MTAAVLKPRLEVIDALRGVAATVVLAQHSAELLWPGYARWSVEAFRPGEWGVFVFFMVSGFVIPLSIERERDPIGFWIGRFFRLFPLYWAVLAAAVVFWRFGDYGVTGQVDARPVVHTLANMTMVQHFMGSSNILGPAWSLAYEMVFYLFITVLLVAGLTRSAVRSTLLTLALACSAGVLLAPTYVLHGTPRNKTALVVAGLVAGALVLVWPRLRSTTDRVIGVAATGAVVVLTLNQPLDLWFSLFLFATIGCGWVYHEAHRGRVDPWVPVALSAATVVLFAFQLRTWVTPHEGAFGASVTWRPDALTLAASHLAFGLVYLVRDRTFPKPVRWLGEISYSTYLVHAVVLNAWRPFPDDPWLTFAAWVVVSLGISALTYRFIELPAQRTGRVLRARWRERAASAPAADGTVRDGERGNTDVPVGVGTVPEPS